MATLQGSQAFEGVSYETCGTATLAINEAWELVGVACHSENGGHWMCVELDDEGDGMRLWDHGLWAQLCVVDGAPELSDSTKEEERCKRARRRREILVEQLRAEIDERRALLQEVEAEVHRAKALVRCHNLWFGGMRRLGGLTGSSCITGMILPWGGVYHCLYGTREVREAVTVLQRLQQKAEGYRKEIKEWEDNEAFCDNALDGYFSGDEGGQGGCYYIKYFV